MMKNILKGVLLGLLVVVLLGSIATVRADVDSIDTTSITIGDRDNTVTFAINTDSSGTDRTGVDITAVQGTHSATVNVDIPASHGTVYATFASASLGLDVARDDAYNVLVSLDDSSGVEVNGTVPVTVTSRTTATHPGILNDADYEDTVAPGDTLSVDISLENNENMDFSDLNIEVWLEDYNGDRLGNRAEVGEFNLRDEADKDFTLNINIPGDADEGDYALFVRIDSDEGLLVNDMYDGSDAVTVERDDNSLRITNYQFTQRDNTLRAAFTVLANGQNDETNTRVTMTIPELGVSYQSDAFLVEEDTEATVYFTASLPGLTTGTYTATVVAQSDEATTTSNYRINLEGESTPSPSLPSFSVSVDATSREMQPIIGGVYTVTLTNNGNAARTFSLATAGTDNWAETSVNPGSVIVAPGTSETATVFVSPNAGASGVNQFTVLVRENAAIVDSLILTSVVESSGSNVGAQIDLSQADVFTGLQFIIGILIIAAIVLFIVSSWRK